MTKTICKKKSDSAMALLTCFTPQDAVGRKLDTTLFQKKTKSGNIEVSMLVENHNHSEEVISLWELRIVQYIEQLISEERYNQLNRVPKLTIDYAEITDLCGIKQRKEAYPRIDDALNTLAKRIIRINVNDISRQGCFLAMVDQRKHRETAVDVDIHPEFFECLLKSQNRDFNPKAYKLGLLASRIYRILFTCRQKAKEMTTLLLTTLLDSIGVKHWWKRELPKKERERIRSTFERAIKEVNDSGVANIQPTDWSHLRTESDFDKKIFGNKVYYRLKNNSAEIEEQGGCLPDLRGVLAQLDICKQLKLSD